MIQNLCRVQRILLYAVPKAGYTVQIVWVIFSYNLFFALAFTIYNMSHVKHMDSKNVTAGQASVVLRAARYIEENPEITTDELIPEIEKWIRDSCMVFVLGNLEYLRAGGRVSNAAYLGASILSLKPLIEIQDRFVKVGNNE